jgi:hypothetical protein
MYTRPIYYSQPAQSINQQHHHSPVLVTPTHTYYPSFVPPANIHPDTLIPLVTYENTVRPNYIGTQYRSMMPVYQNNIPTNYSYIPTINPYIPTINSSDSDWVVTPVSILPDEQYKCIGYTSIGEDGRYIAKIGIPHDAKHNMDRIGIVSKEHAMYKTNKVHVLNIRDIISGDYVDYLDIKTCRGDNKIYRVNHQIITEFYDTVDDTYCIGIPAGIYFYLSEEIIRKSNIIEHTFDFTGITKKYNYNGNLESEIYYENGKLIKSIYFMHK